MASFCCVHSLSVTCKSACILSHSSAKAYWLAWISLLNLMFVSKVQQLTVIFNPYAQQCLSLSWDDTNQQCSEGFFPLPYPRQMPVMQPWGSLGFGMEGSLGGGCTGTFAAWEGMYLNRGAHCCRVWGDGLETGIRWRHGGKDQGVLVDTLLKVDMLQPVSAGKAYRGRRNCRRNPVLLLACYPTAEDFPRQTQS